MFDFDFKNRRVLVTGGSGFIGQSVIALGLQSGAEIHSLSRGEVRIPGVKVWKADVRQTGQIQDALRQIAPDAIIHLAAAGVSYRSGGLADLLSVNVEGLENLLREAAEGKRCRKVVIAGSGFEYSPAPDPVNERSELAPLSLYGISKAAATMIAGRYSSAYSVTILRLFNVFGPGERIPRLMPHVISKIVQGQPVPLTNGEQIRDYTAVVDAAEAFWRALAMPANVGQILAVNIGSGRPITLRYFVERIAAEMRTRGYSSDLQFGAIPYRPDEAMCYLPDVRRCRDVFRWTPSGDIERLIADSVDKMLSD